MTGDEELERNMKANPSDGEGHNAHTWLDPSGIAASSIAAEQHSSRAASK